MQILEQNYLIAVRAMMKSYNAFQLSGKKRHFSAIIMAVIAVEVVADIDLDLG